MLDPNFWLGLVFHPDVLFITLLLWVGNKLATSAK